MGKSKLVLIFLSSLIVNISTIDYSFAQVECNTDEITGNTLCETSRDYLREIDADTQEADFQLYYSKNDRSYFGLLTGYASDWQWLRTETLYILAGDKRFQFEISQSDNDVNGGNVAEQMIVYFSADDLRNIFSTQGDIKLKLGNDSYQIKFDSFKNEAIELVETVETAKKILG